MKHIDADGFKALEQTKVEDLAKKWLPRKLHI